MGKRKPPKPRIRFALHDVVGDVARVRSAGLCPCGGTMWVVVHRAGQVLAGLSCDRTCPAKERTG